MIRMRQMFANRRSAGYLALGAAVLVVVILVFLGGRVLLGGTEQADGVTAPDPGREAATTPAKKPTERQEPKETTDQKVERKEAEKKAEEAKQGAAEMPEPAASELAEDPAALKKCIEEIAAYYGGTYGVIVSDPASKETVSLGADETFFAASLGKLPTMLSLYKAVDDNEIKLDDAISMLSSDVQSYGTGVLHTYPVGHTLTLRETAYYLMNKSDNTAWAMLTRYLGVDGIQADLSGIGAYDTGYWVPNTTTANDVLLMLEKIADPSFTSASLSKEMLGSMTDTAFEDRIPAGLPQDVRVAHKIGTYENSFSDAGVVFYEGPNGEEKHYFIVVLVEGAGEANARAAIQEISAATHETFATPRR